MGITKTLASGTAIVKIDDGCIAGMSREESARRWAEVDRAIWRVLRASAEGAGGNAKGGREDV